MAADAATMDGPSLASRIARLALVGVIGGAVLVAFAYVGGRLTPWQLTPAGLVDTFELVNGPHPGFPATTRRASA